MMILVELVFYCSLVILLHGTSSLVMPMVEASSHVMPAWACAMVGIYGCGHLFQSFCLETMDSAAIETSLLSSEFEY